MNRDSVFRRECPAGIPYPENLDRLVHGNLDTLHTGDDNTLDLWMEAEKTFFAAWLRCAEDDPRLERLFGFAKKPCGSWFALWDNGEGDVPVVFVSSESYCEVVTENFDDFVRLLGVGYRSIGWGGTDMKHPPRGEIFDGENYAGDDTVTWFRKTFGLVSPETGGEIIYPAQRRLGADFHRWIEEIIGFELDCSPWNGVADPESTP